MWELVGLTAVDNSSSNTVSTPVALVRGLWEKPNMMTLANDNHLDKGLITSRQRVNSTYSKLRERLHSQRFAGLWYMALE